MMERTNQKKACLSLIVLAAVIAGCGGRGVIRQYEEINISPTVSGPSLAPSGQAAPGFTWTAPEGWKSIPASGWRLAAFEVEKDSGKAVCTIITLEGDAGGLAANVERWLGQLNLQAPPRDELNEILAGEKRFRTDAGFESMMVDLSRWTEGDDPARTSMIAGIIAAGPQTLFIKLTGPHTLLAEEKANLESLCESIARKQ
ncbi:MAG: hypothetical protein KJ626_01370 [Verrucomicrobia bacterium]|nr:hypothetical protein [Verrucomicrobiota bacterium]